MNILSLKPKSGGFLIIRDGKKTTWMASIGSMVPVKKRTELSHYYIIVKKGKKIVDRLLYENSSIAWINGGDDIPKYIREPIEDIMLTADLNKYSDDIVYDNGFTRLGMTKE